MLSERLKKRLQKDHPMTSITLAHPGRYGGILKGNCPAQRFFQIPDIAECHTSAKDHTKMRNGIQPYQRHG